jgi:prepilin-type N-terminal cleavage/methylation domain-containing protein/prepilin-type processing-associated H-X9-DG protein
MKRTEIKQPGARKSAFTLIELLVVIAIVAMLAGLLLPALAASQGRSSSATCLANLKRLQVGGAMYSADNNDYMMPNAPYGYQANETWCGGNGENWTIDIAGGVNGAGNISNTNWAYYTKSLMAPYVANDIGIYRCPADSVPSTDGLRLRTYSMNGQVGAVYTQAGTADGSSEYDTGAAVYVYNSDLQCPGPANTIVFVHESTYTQLRTYSDGWLQISTETPGFPDAPCFAAHGGACGFSFADGHSEMHRWMTDCLNLPNGYGQSPAPGVWGVTPDGIPTTNADWQWFSQHTACLKNGTLPP